MKKINVKSKFMKGLLLLFLLTQSKQMIANENTVENNSQNKKEFNLTNLNISITNNVMKKGLELGDNSNAVGDSAISTSREGIAIGNNSVATGGVETKESILNKLRENEEKLNEIKRMEKVILEKTEMLKEKQIRERATIEAAMRVEQVLQAKERAKIDWQNKLNDYNTNVENSKSFFAEHQAKIDDLNSRLSGLATMEGIDISSDEGLVNAARKLKERVENGTTLNLTVDFYKEYVNNYYRALGDLRRNEVILSSSSSSSFYRTDSRHVDMNVGVKDPKSHYHNLEGLSMISSGFGGTGLANYSRSTIDFYNGEFYGSYLNLTNVVLNNKNIQNDITSKTEYDKAIIDASKYKEAFKNYFKENNNPFLTDDIKEQMYEIFDLKVDWRLKKYEITYYQKMYEDTKNLSWLDKKSNAIKELEIIENNFNIIREKDGGRPHEKVAKNIEKWKKENIDVIKEKNKITVNTLTTELETALGINKKAVENRKIELENMKKVSDTAKINYENINPNEIDVILAREYERVKQEINNLVNSIIESEDRLKVLKETLTLHDLRNIGENNIAIGTNAIAVGSNVISMGKGATAIGENSISIGKDSDTVGTNSISLGIENKIYGNNTINIGYNNKVRGNNVVALGQNLVLENIENGIVLGNGSTGVNNAVSVGSENNLRKITNVAEGDITDVSNDVITGKQLKAQIDALKTTTPNIDLSNYHNKGEVEKLIEDKIKNIKPTIIEERSSNENSIDENMLNEKLNNYVKKDGSNIDEDSKKLISAKLNEGANIKQPNEVLVTDKDVKEYTDELKKDIANETENKIGEAENRINKRIDRLNGVVDLEEVKQEIKDTKETVINVYNEMDKKYNDLKINMDEEVKRLRNEIYENKRKADSGVASAMAMASLPQPVVAGQGHINYAMANYGSGTASAFGYSRVTNDGKMVIKTSFSIDNRTKIGVAFGISFVLE